jgi:hypothetical protein
MNDMLDDRFDEHLREAAREYNSPPETPRDVMWERIVAARTGKAEKADRTEKVDGSSTVVIPLRPLRPLRLPLGIAALLAIGVGLGRLTAPPPESPSQASIATEIVPEVSDLAYRVAATEHLSQSEAFLTLFRSSVRRGGNEQLASSTARQLLATNRLLLDSPAGGDNRIRLLLQDLELVLAQIAQLSSSPRSPDLDLITEDLEDSGVMSRLRTAVPSGTSTTQGVL